MRRPTKLLAAVLLTLLLGPPIVLGALYAVGETIEQHGEMP